MQEQQNETGLAKSRLKNFHKLRYVIYFTIWLTLLALCNQRVLLGVASVGFLEIVDTPNSKPVTTPPVVSQTVTVSNPVESSSDAETCKDKYTDKNEKIIEDTTKVKWTTSQRETSFLTYNLGYMIGHVPGTFLTVKIGIHAVMMICIISCTILTLVSIFVVGHYYWFLAVRVAIGFISGSMYPVVNEAVAVHSPPAEQHLVHMCIHTANFLSSAIVFPLGGYFIEKYVDGWKYIFVFSFVIGILASICWSLFAWSEPDENPFMSKQEQKYIRTALYPNGKPPKKTLSNVPYVSIFTDLQLYVNSITHFAKLMILYMNLIGVVTYFREFYKIGPFYAGSLGVVPFVGECFLQLTYSHIIKFIVRDKLDKTKLRRLNTLIGAIGCFVFLISAAFVSCNNIAAGVILQSISLMFVAPYQGGYFLGIVERYGRFSGITFSFINIAGSLSGIIQRLIFLSLKDRFQKDIVKTYKYSFITTACLSFALSLPYVFLGVVDKPEWVQASVPIPQANIVITKDSEGNSTKDVKLASDGDDDSYES